MQTNITRFISCLVSLMLCIHTGASALFYSTILNSRRQMALAAALAAKDQEEFERQIKRAKRFAKENKALSATGVGVSAGLGIGGGLETTFSPNAPGNPKTFFWDKLITGKKAIVQDDAFMGNVCYLMPWLYGVLPAALSLKQSIGDEKSAARIMTQAPFVHRLMQSPEFLKDIGLDDPQRMHRMVKKMERVAVSLQVILTTISGIIGLFSLGAIPSKKNSLRNNGTLQISSGLALATLTAVITTPFFAFAFKPLLLAIWRKLAGIPDMKRINKAIMHAIAHKTEWEAIFATEDAAKTSAPIAAVPVATQEEAA